MYFVLVYVFIYLYSQRKPPTHVCTCRFPCLAMFGSHWHHRSNVSTWFRFWAGMLPGGVLFSVRNIFRCSAVACCECVCGECACGGWLRCDALVRLLAQIEKSCQIGICKKRCAPLFHLELIRKYVPKCWIHAWLMPYLCLGQTFQSVCCVSSAVVFASDCRLFCLLAHIHPGLSLFPNLP